jgi:hypothetical protein
MPLKKRSNQRGRKSRSNQSATNFNFGPSIDAHKHGIIAAFLRALADPSTVRFDGKDPSEFLIPRRLTIDSVSSMEALSVLFTPDEIRRFYSSSYLIARITEDQRVALVLDDSTMATTAHPRSSPYQQHHPTSSHPDFRSTSAAATHHGDGGDVSQEDRPLEKEELGEGVPVEHTSPGSAPPVPEAVAEALLGGESFQRNLADLANRRTEVFAVLYKELKEAQQEEDPVIREEFLAAAKEKKGAAMHQIELEQQMLFSARDQAVAVWSSQQQLATRMTSTPLGGTGSPGRSFEGAATTNSQVVLVKDNSDRLEKKREKIRKVLHTFFMPLVLQPVMGLIHAGNLREAWRYLENTYFGKLVKFAGTLDALLSSYKIAPDQELMHFVWILETMSEACDNILHRPPDHDRLYCHPRGAPRHPCQLPAVPRTRSVHGKRNHACRVHHCNCSEYPGEHGYDRGGRQPSSQAVGRWCWQQR